MLIKKRVQGVGSDQLICMWKVFPQAALLCLILGRGGPSILAWPHKSNPLQGPVDLGCCVQSRGREPT